MDPARHDLGIRNHAAAGLRGRRPAIEVVAIRPVPAAPVFPNPKTGQPWAELRRPFRKAVRTAGLHGLWFHDLRRSFVTHARKAGIPESVVMRMSGHKTRAVFDRYNVVDESDLRLAARTLENHGPVLDTVAVSEGKNTEAPQPK
jgi:integrase